MCKDDYFVIVYKILKYLYECMKAGKRPAAEDIACENQMFCIPETYWTQIMIELIDQAYVRGIFTVPMTGAGTVIKITPDAAITMKGVEFLQDNSKLQKAKEFSGKGFEIILNGIISQLPLIATMIM